jgi:putative transposase
VRAGIAVSAEAYRWSSAAAHCGLKKDSILSPGLPFLDSISDWSGWLAPEEKLEDVEFIRERTQSGRPCASDEFARMLEARLGRPLLKRKTGPKKKADAEVGSIAPVQQKSLGFE